MMARAIADLVDRGMEIRKQIKALEKEFKQIEEKLEKAGLEGDQVDLKDADREGRRFLARGSRVIVPVIFTADKLVQSFAAGSPIEQKIRAKSGGFFADFWKPVNAFETLFKDGKRFRAQARELLADGAPAFITACVSRDKFGVAKSDAKIAWDDAEEVTSVTAT